MRFMRILKSNKDAEAGKMPSVELIDAEVRYDGGRAKAGVLLDAEGSYPSSTGARVTVSADVTPTVTDGPLTVSKELIGSYWIIQAKSPEEAIEWAKRSPAAPCRTTEIEVRRFIELES